MIIEWLFFSAGFAQTTSWYQKDLGLEHITGQRAQTTIVAVIDTGIDSLHPALKNALWTNPGETGQDAHGRDKATNGIDDDNNGFVDDVHGWNFANQNSNLKDDHGHGTHIAGLIAADSSFFTGIAPGTKLMVLKYFDPKAPIGGNLMNSVRAIKYATQMGAHIINYSGGGFDASAAEKAALTEAREKGVLVVAAAGNESTNADAIGFYPASYNLSNILSVAALGPDHKRLPSSNWGPKSVQISAPGEQILSTFPNQQMAYMTGTSQATAVVTALAVLLREKRPDLKTPESLIQALVKTGSFSSKLVGQIKNPSRVSLERAVSMQDSKAEELDVALSTYKNKARN